jgi:hypothetical protein
MKFIFTLFYKLQWQERKCTLFIIMLLDVHLKKLNLYIGKEYEQELENPR